MGFIDKIDEIKYFFEGELIILVFSECSFIIEFWIKIEIFIYVNINMKVEIWSDVKKYKLEWNDSIK